MEGTGRHDFPRPGSRFPTPLPVESSRAEIGPSAVQRVRGRFTLGGLLLSVALVAVVLSVAAPIARKALGPNTWVVRTVTRPDGSVVRIRIRRLPGRDLVFEEILTAPVKRPSSATPGR